MFSWKSGEIILLKTAITSENKTKIFFTKKCLKFVDIFVKFSHPYEIKNRLVENRAKLLFNWECGANSFFSHDCYFSNLKGPLTKLTEGNLLSIWFKLREQDRNVLKNKTLHEHNVRKLGLRLQNQMSKIKNR